MDTAKIKQITEESLKESPGGVVCKFVKLDNKWALKIYPSKFKRDEAYYNQCNCYDHGFAPATGETIDLPMGYAYVTEIIRPAAKWIKEGEPGYAENKRKGWAWEDRNFELIDETTELIYQLTNWWFEDNHPWNWGYNKKGVLIPLDFGEDDGNDYNYSNIENEMIEVCEDE